MGQLKKCNTCLVEKDVSLFRVYKRANRVLVVKPLCIACSRIKQRLRPQGGKGGKHPYERGCPKEKARRKIRYEIKMGRILRQPCEICGAEAQAHHDDYSKPLDVRWFCPKHHKEHHWISLDAPLQKQYTPGSAEERVGGE
jgi:hypothetical protein